MKLENVLTFKDVFFTSLGYIVGAGIYSLLNITTRYGGNLTYISFIIGGFIAIMTGLSYADLAKVFDSNAAEYGYITKTLGGKMKHIIGFVLIGMGILIMATLMIAFSNYITKIFPNVNYKLVLTLLILVTTSINSLGVKLTTNVNLGISITESLTLIVLILFSLNKWKLSEITVPFNKIKYDNILHSSFITIFTLTGFQAITKLAEETKNSKKVIPKAIILSLSVALVIYILVSISCNSVLGTTNVSNTVSPISDAFGKILGKNSYTIVNIIAIFSIFNTVMLTQLFTSRQLYGISKDNIFHKTFTNINSKFKTPINSILFVGSIAFILSNFKNIENSTIATNIFIFSLFMLVNLSAIILRYKNKNKKTDYFIKSPAHSYIGLISCVCLLYKSISNNYFKG